jgi:hypothetical protein
MATVTFKTLDELSRADLVDRWITANKNPPPKGLSRRILEYSAAYHVQAKASGGLSRTAKRQLAKVAHNQTDNTNPASSSLTTKVPPPGSRLIREWHGISHTVDVTEAGFVYYDRRYCSLSEVARAITGARWSGPRFFGL